MTVYVQSANSNTWHWCKNCIKYPTNITNSQRTRPKWDLCEECKKKEKNNNCS